MSVSTLRLSLLLCCLGSVLLAPAQSRDHTLVAASIQLSDLPQQRITPELSFNPIRYLGLHLSYGLSGTQTQQGDFTRELEEQVMGGQLRVFPFGAPKLFQSGQFFRYGFRSKANFDDSWAQTFLSGLYVGMGYEHRTASLRYLPDESLNSPWEEFQYEITDTGPTAQLGYSLVLSHLYVNVAYRWRFSQPQWQGPVDVFGDDLYTKSYPLEYRRTGGLQLAIGAAF